MSKIDLSDIDAQRERVRAFTKSLECIRGALRDSAVDAENMQSFLGYEEARDWRFSVEDIDQQVRNIIDCANDELWPEETQS